MAEDSWENDVSKSNRKSNQKKQRSAKSALPVSKRPRLDTPDTSTDNSGNVFVVVVLLLLLLLLLLFLLLFFKRGPHTKQKKQKRCQSEDLIGMGSTKLPITLSELTFWERQNYLTWSQMLFIILSLRKKTLLFFSYLGADRILGGKKKEMGVPEVVCRKREFAARWSSSEV